MRARDDLIRTNLRMVAIELREVESAPIQVTDALRRIDDVLGIIDASAIRQESIDAVAEIELRAILSLLFDRLEQDVVLPVQLLAFVPLDNETKEVELIWEDAPKVRRIYWKFKPSYWAYDRRIWGYEVFVSLESGEVKRRYDDQLPFFIPVRSLATTAMAIDQLIGHVKTFVVNW